MRWVLDTGASRHITSEASMLHNPRPVPDNVTITFGSGGTGKPTAMGEVILCAADTTFHLNDILCIPEATKNLISVRQATSRGLDFNFNASKCQISQGGRSVATAPPVGDSIYYLMGWGKRNPSMAQQTEGAESSPAFAARAKETPHLWHERFGHLGNDNLARFTSMVSGISITADEFKTAAAGADSACEPCALGKQHRSPFKTSTSAATRPLALVHTDVCGPLPVSSLGGNNYFVTLLDDNSKLSAVYPIPRKSDTADTVIDALTLLENQSGYSVQRLRCDNGSEYINARLKEYCRVHGIKLETTVRYTPEQNGAAERLNRTLMDKIRPMLSASSCPWEALGSICGQRRQSQPTTCAIAHL